MSAATLRFVLGDQLSTGLASLRDADPARDVVLMAEVHDECTYVPHHKRKIALVLSAMRHFAADLRAAGFTVDYQALDSSGGPASLRAALLAAVARHRPEKVVVVEPGEYRLRAEMMEWSDAAQVPVEVLSDDRFFWSTSRFDAWAEGRRQLRMEDFYRVMRRETGLLMDGSGPVSGVWNLDRENRKRLPKGTEIPPRLSFTPDAITQDVLALVEGQFANHFGRLDGFDMPVTADEAEAAFAYFLTHHLPHFGDYQDAMAAGAPYLFHSVISPALNLGLLDPRDLCRRAEQCWAEGAAPLNAVEGFIRQILGWREFVRGVYWLRMPDYAQTNFFDAARPLPGFYWTGETDMRCMAEAIGQTRDLAYAHHIQRLMVTGNFALLAGLAPDEVCAWYLVVYADAYEWVELPNTHGMALFADGGVLGSKPYASSGKYIARQSDYCSGCRYDVTQRTGPDACPFNFLYWDFLARNRTRLADNHRMRLIYASLDRMDSHDVAAMRSQAAAFLDSLR